ncbi:MAG: zinc ribbon domain-containing protein [Chloroflexi bacterium]|nr:zinc ribbon domain-containing protein [Chloroflexota bacterium]
MPDTRGLYASVLRLVVQLIVLVIINGILTELPMVKAITIPGLPVAITSIISLIIGLVAVTVILIFRRDFIPRLRANYPGYPQAATIVSEAITLAIIVIIYVMCEGSIRPFMKQLAWLYPVIFLAIALWPLYILITTLYRSSGPIADWASTKIAPAPTVSIDNELKCTSCGELIPSSARYCTSCGASTGTSVSGSKCAACGALNRAQDKYCLNCGALLDENEEYDTRVSV